MKSKAKTRASSVDLHYLASFLDGYDRDFLDEIAELKDYSQIAKRRHVSTRYIRTKAKEMVAGAYEMMWECVHGNIDKWTLGIVDVIYKQREITDKLFLDLVKSDVRKYGPWDLLRWTRRPI